MNDYRAEFPSSAQGVFLNHAGVAPLSLRVARAMQRWIDDALTHGPLHIKAWEERLTATRAAAAALLGASATEVAFVRNTSHGLGLIAESIDWREGDEVVVASSLEYPSNVYVWQHLARRGVVVRDVPAVGGRYSIDEVRAAMTAKTRVVAVSAVQYATGQVVDVAAVGTLCRERGALLSVDAIQVLGARPFDVKALGVHFAAADAHKWLLGPCGVGIMYADAAHVPALTPPIVGWHSTVNAYDFDRAALELRADAGRFEEGTPTYVALDGLGAALELITEVGPLTIAKRLAQHTETIAEQARALGWQVGPDANERAGIITLLPPAGADALDQHLRARNIFGIVRRGRLRLSPHFYTNRDDLAAVAAAMNAFA